MRRQSIKVIDYRNGGKEFRPQIRQSDLTAGFNFGFTGLPKARARDRNYFQFDQERSCKLSANYC